MRSVIKGIHVVLAREDGPEIVSCCWKSTVNDLCSATGCKEYTHRGSDRNIMINSLYIFRKFGDIWKKNWVEIHDF